MEYGFFTIKNQEWLENQRYAGKVLSKALSLAKEGALDGKSTSDLNKICEDYILDNEGCSPTFKGYINFPATACVSVNEEVVHGIPKDDFYLKNGDIVKIDCGVTYKGVIVDSAISVVVGEYKDKKHRELLEGCERCLYNVIEHIGNNIGKIRLGDIGYFISKEAKRMGANAVKELTGHGLEFNTPHWFPMVSNYGEKDKGILLLPNMTFCIEPIFVFGDSKTHVKEDGFTMAAKSVGVHWEHTIFLHEDRVEIIT